MKQGDLSVPKDYYNYLSNLLSHLEKFNPVSHIKKHDLIKGDATSSIKKFTKKKIIIRRKNSMRSKIDKIMKNNLLIKTIGNYSFKKIGQGIKEMIQYAE